MLTTFKEMLATSLLLALASLSVPFVNLALSHLLSTNQPLVIPTDQRRALRSRWRVRIAAARAFCGHLRRMRETSDSLADGAV